MTDLNAIPLAGPSPDLKATTSSAPVRDEAAWEQAKAFEAQFLSEMLKLADLVPTPSGFGGGFGEEAFSAMLVDQYATTMVETRSFGLAEEVYNIIRGEAP